MVSLSQILPVFIFICSNFIVDKLVQKLYLSRSNKKWDAPDTIELKICEPDFLASDPINSWQDDLTQTLKVTRNQALLLKNLELKNGECSFFEKIVAIKNILDYPKIYMQRQEVDNKRDSGWFIGYADRSHENMDIDDPNNYESMYIYELIQKRPELLEIICLPVGYIVVFENNAIQAILDNKDRVIFENKQSSVVL